MIISCTNSFPKVTLNLFNYQLPSKKSVNMYAAANKPTILRKIKLSFRGATDREAVRGCEWFYDTTTWGS